MAEIPVVLKRSDDRSREGRGLPEVGLRGIGLHALSEAECAEVILSESAAGRGGWVASMDLYRLRRCLKDPTLLRSFSSAELRVADDPALLLACRLQRTPLPERVCGPNLLTTICHGAAARGRKIFLLGAEEDALETVTALLKEWYPKLEIAGTAVTPAEFEQDPLAFGKLALQLKRARPDVVFLAAEPIRAERIFALLREELEQAWYVWAGPSFRGIDPEFQPRARGLMSGDLLRRLPVAIPLLMRSVFRGIVPKSRVSGRYGIKKPCCLLVDDDPFALEHLEWILANRFPELQFVRREEPSVEGEFDIYFLDNDFNGERMIPQLVRSIRAKDRPALVFAFSAKLDTETLKKLINFGCDGVCEKNSPNNWQPAFELIEKRLEKMVRMRREEAAPFGGVRHAARSIHELLSDWNSRAEKDTAVDADTTAREVPKA